MSVIETTSESPGSANANTGAPSGEQGGKNESAVMATSPKEDHYSQSTVLNRIYKGTELLLFSKIY
jgi:hypothetical protein